MYLTLNTETWAVAALDDKRALPPVKQYVSNVLIDHEILATVTGRNTKARQFQATIEMHPYHLGTNPNMRGMSLIVTLSSIVSKKLAFSTNLKTTVTPELMEKLFGKKPNTFFHSLAVLERAYAEDSRIDHEPWLGQFISEKTEGKVIRTWADVRDAGLI